MTRLFFRIAVVLGLVTMVVGLSFHYADAQQDTAEISVADEDGVQVSVFQAAGPTKDSIQGSVDQYRATLGIPNNGNAPGPLAVGRREINWDGGSLNNQTTAIAGNPFTGFLVTRGALFTTPDGTGFVQAPPSADPILFPPGGLAGLFNNPTYQTTFATFSAAAIV